MLVITSGKKGDKTDILKFKKKIFLIIVFQQFKKTDETYFFFRTFEWMYGEALSRPFTQ